MPFVNHRSECPKCGTKKSFAKFVDSDNGYCHNGCKIVIVDSDNASFIGKKIVNPETRPIKVIKRENVDEWLSPDIIKESTLFKKIANKCDSDKVIATFLRYGVGAKKVNYKGKIEVATIYLYQNSSGFVGTKDVVYDDNLKRLTTGTYYTKARGYANSLFGSHLLTSGCSVVIVESEKDALISACFSDNNKVFLGAGGTNRFTTKYMEEVISANVNGIEIIPDNDEPGFAAAAKWKEKLEAKGCEATIVITNTEKLYSGKPAGYDIGMYYLDID